MSSADPSSLDPVRRDTMNPHAFGLARPSTASWPLIGRLDAWFSDKRYNVSRPKLIFAISMIDFVAVVSAGLIAAWATGMDADRSGWLMVLRTIVVAVTVTALMRREWAYTISALRQPAVQWQRIFKSLMGGFLVLSGTAYLGRFTLFTPDEAIVWMLAAAAVMMGSRFGVAKLLSLWTKAGRLVRRTVIVGGGPDAEAVISSLEANAKNNLQILGVFDDRDDDRSSDSFGGYPKLGNFEQLAAFCRNAGVELLIVTVPTIAEDRLLQILKRLFTLQVDIRISALSSKLRLNSRAYSHIGGVPMLAAMDRPLTDWDRAIKNLEDRILGSIIFVLAAPIMALVAVAVRLDSKGPILFKQRRFGFNNELIEVYKFRSMYADQSDATAAKLVTKGDPRVTRVGRFIRKTSLDELPQLINVLKGEMSLVGPRPHATQAKANADLYQSVVSGYYARHRMKPGVTGWAQVNGWRGETDTHEKIQRRVELDLAYIDEWSLPFDLYILALTPFALLSAKNAY
ncbi:MAG: undecaprenyl-phosphate glucose phosphotransferase [Hyphomicrobium sp.]